MTKTRKLAAGIALLAVFGAGALTSSAVARQTQPQYRNVYELASSITPGTRAQLVLKCSGTEATEDSLSILIMTKRETGRDVYRCVGTRPRWEAMR
jgi:hypothetical protein